METAVFSGKGRFWPVCIHYTLAIDVIIKKCILCSHCLCVVYVGGMYVCACRPVVVAHADQILAVCLCGSVLGHCYQSTCHLQHCLHASVSYLSDYLQGQSVLQG